MPLQALQRSGCAFKARLAKATSMLASLGSCLLPHFGFGLVVDLLLNGKPYSAKGAFTLESDSPHIGTGRFDAYETDFALVARC